MTPGDIINVISTVGFPIACCVYLFYSNDKQQKKHEEEIDKLRETNENNTEEMVEIKTLMGVKKNE
jgi:Ca2+/Na+ antiporter